MSRRALLAGIAIVVAATLFIVLGLDIDGAGRRTAAQPSAPPGSPGSVSPAAVLSGRDEGPDDALSLPTSSTEGVRTAPQSSVTVQGPDGHPIHDARVVAWRGTESTVPSTTNLEGMAVCAGADSLDGVLVEADGWPIQILGLDSSLSRHVVRLQAGGAVAGTVRVDGLVPRDRLTLKLLSETPYFEWGRVPPALLDDLWAREIYPHELTAIVDVSGAFVFQGLAAGWSGAVEFPGNLLVDRIMGKATLEPDHGVRLEAPASGLAVELVSLPVVTGRVVLAGTNQGLPGVDVSLHLSHAFDGMRSSVGCTTDGAGRFSGALQMEDQRLVQAWREDRTALRVASGWASLSLASPPGTGPFGEAAPGAFASSPWVQRSVRADQMRGPFDVGDLEFPRARDVRFRVTDEGGRPIAGAFGHAGAFGQPTDEDGVGMVEVLGEPSYQLMVGAHGYAIAFIEIPPVVESPLAVVLARASQLEIHVDTPPGVEREFLRLVVQGEQALLSGEPFRTVEMMRRLGGSLMEPDRSGHEDEPNTICFSLGQADSIRVVDVLPQQITVRVEGRLRATIQEEPAFVLAAGERRRVDIVLSAAVRDLTGQVVDAGGRPIKGARVGLSTRSNYPGLYRVTGQDGRVRFEQVGAQRAQVSVSAEGYAALEEPDLELPRDGALEPFRLQFDRQVRVVVEDPHGRQIAAESVTATETGWWVHMAARDGGGYLLPPGLPAVPLTLTANVGGRIYEQALGAQDIEARVLVPEHGSVHVDFSGLEPDSSAKTRVLLRSVQGDIEVTRAPSDGALPMGSVDFEAVLPGSYSVFVSRWTGQQNVWTKQAPSVPLTVTAGRIVRVDWQP